MPVSETPFANSYLPELGTNLVTALRAGEQVGEGSVCARKEGRKACRGQRVPVLSLTCPPWMCTISLMTASKVEIREGLCGGLIDCGLFSKFPVKPIERSQPKSSPLCLQVHHQFSCMIEGAYLGLVSKDPTFSGLA